MSLFLRGAVGSNMVRCMAAGTEMFVLTKAAVAEASVEFPTNVIRGTVGARVRVLLRAGRRAGGLGFCIQGRQGTISGSQQYEQLPTGSLDDGPDWITVMAAMNGSTCVHCQLLTKSGVITHPPQTTVPVGLLFGHRPQAALFPRGPS